MIVVSGSDNERGRALLPEGDGLYHLEERPELRCLEPTGPRAVQTELGLGDPVELREIGGGRVRQLRHC